MDSTVGGGHGLNICCIKLIETRSSFQDIITALTLFDNLISSAEKFVIFPDNCNGILLSKLFNYTITQNISSINQYVYNTFISFITQKTKIEINLDNAAGIKDKYFLDIVLFDIEADGSKYDRDECDFTNLIRPQIIKLFKNLTQITINTGDWSGTYTISLLALLSMIKNSSVTDVTIRDYGNEWLSKLWKRSSNEIIERYEKAMFSITYNYVDRINIKIK